MKVLVVDDETTIADIITETFIDEGLNAHALYSGNQAIEFLKKEEVVFILSDVRMPDGDGLSLAKAIQDMKLDTKLMFMTGYSEYSEEDLRARGALRVFSKPIDFDLVVMEVVNFIKNLDK